MIKKIKDLTSEEMKDICISRSKGYVYCENAKCPLWLGGQCLKGFIEKIQHLEKEISIND